MQIPETKYLTKVEGMESDQLQQYISGAFLATNLAILVQLLQLPNLSPSLTVALWCVAVSMPGLAFDFLLILYTKERGYYLHIFPRPRYETFFGVIVLLSLCAIASVIHHFLPPAAYAFSALAMFSFYRMRRYVSKLEREIELSASTSNGGSTK
jgi:hypothetical protein